MVFKSASKSTFNYVDSKTNTGLRMSIELAFKINPIQSI